ncbi:MAG TPA: hypothetical protein VMG98_13800 [Verrucomicrobiae bacterium]|nr:hypothetical protein [Verrucomicrobiae bacterium]
MLAPDQPTAPNIRDEKLIVVAAVDACGECKETHVRAGIECSTGNIKAWCANTLCARFERARYLDRPRNIKNWPDEPKRNERGRRKRRDPDLEFSLDRRDYIFARDKHCAHCGAALFEEVDASEATLLVSRPQIPAPQQESLLEKSEPTVTHAPHYERQSASIVRRSLPREVDHIFFYWAGLRLKADCDVRTLELIGRIAGVAACADCNRDRQLPPPEAQLLNEAAADEIVSGMLRLFTNHVLGDPDVDALRDTYRFLRVLAKLKSLLTGKASRRAG